MLQSLPEQVTPAAQLSRPLQVICELDALLPMDPTHAESAHVILHSDPAQRIGPAHEPLALQWISQVLPWEQSTPAGQPLSPHVTRHG
jgi:hypothetical protein